MPAMPSFLQHLRRGNNPPTGLGFSHGAKLIRLTTTSVAVSTTQMKLRPRSATHKYDPFLVRAAPWESAPSTSSLKTTLGEGVLTPFRLRV